MTFRRAVALLLALTSGCGLLFDTHAARRAGPTAPVVHITPSEPRTADELRVDFDAISEDALGGELTYAYAWTRDEQVVAVDATLSSAHTHKGERWTVTVTPIASDGRRGEAATADVTIRNTVPSIASIGLSQYDPFDDDVLELFVGPTADDDGDVVSRAIEWRVNGVVIDQTTPQLALADMSLAAGDTIEARVVPSDGEASGEPQTAGPARVRPSGSQWRALTPDRTSYGVSTTAVYDPVRRSVFLFGSELFEYRVDERRWVRLVPESPELGAVFSYTPPILDVENRRILIVNLTAMGDTHTNEIRVLDIRTPGREAWRAITLAPGAVPAPFRYFEAAALDARRHRILLHGGLCASDGFGRVCDDLWAIDLTPGEERWERLAEHAGVGASAGALWLVDDVRDRAYLIGGTRPIDADDEQPAVPTRDVYALDLRTDAFAPSPVAQAPAMVTFAGGAVVSGQREAFVFHGADAFTPTMPQRAVWRFDLETLDFTDVEVVGDEALMPPSISPNVAYDAADDRFVVVHGGRRWVDGVQLGGELGIAALGRVDRAVQGIDEPGIHAPRGTSSAFARLDSQGRMVLVSGRGGTLSGSRLEPASFTIEPSGRMRPFAPTPAPSLRFGAASGAAHDDAMLAFGGSRLEAGSEIPLGDVWSMAAFESTWSFLGTFSGVDATHGRAWGCDAGSGWLLAGTSSTPLSRFDCDDGLCALTPSAVVLPNVVGTAIVGLEPDTLVVLGAGGSATSPGDRVFIGPRCGVGEWEEIVVAGIPQLRGATAHPLSASSVERRAIVAGTGFMVDGGAVAAGIFDMDGPTFSAIETTGPTPPMRYYAAVTWDPARGRLLVYGGQRLLGGAIEQSELYGDLWELRYETPP